MPNGPDKAAPKPQAAATLPLPHFIDWDSQIKVVGQDSVAEAKMKENGSWYCAACGYPCKQAKNQCPSCGTFDTVATRPISADLEIDVPTTRGAWEVDLTKGGKK